MELRRTGGCGSAALEAPAASRSLPSSRSPAARWQDVAALTGPRTAPHYDRDAVERRRGADGTVGTSTVVRPPAVILATRCRRCRRRRMSPRRCAAPGISRAIAEAVAEASGLAADRTDELAVVGAIEWRVRTSAPASLASRRRDSEALVTRDDEDDDWVATMAASASVERIWGVRGSTSPDELTPASTRDGGPGISIIGIGSGSPLLPLDGLTRPGLLVSTSEEEHRRDRALGGRGSADRPARSRVVAPAAGAAGTSGRPGTTPAPR